MTSQSSTPSSFPTYLQTPAIAEDGDFDHEDFCVFLASGASLNWSGITTIILSIVNLIGNCFLIAAILGNKNLWTKFDFLLLNLCISSILYFFGWSLQYVEFQLHPCWQFGVVICKLTHACKYLSIAAYGFFMIVLSYERYCAITNRFNSPRASILIILTWSLSFFVCLPVLIFAHVPLEIGCFYVPPRQPSGQAYVTAVFIITYAIPAIVSVIFYVLMARVLFAGTPQTTCGGQYPGTRESKARGRLAIVILILLAFFTASMFTFHVYELSVHFATLSAWWHYDFFKQFHHVSAYANFSCCPWIVFAASKVHREALVELLICKRRSRDTDAQPVDADSPGNSLFAELPSNEPPADSGVL